MQQKPASMVGEREIDHFIDYLSTEINQKPKTVSSYLEALINYLKHEKRNELADHANQEKLKFDKEHKAKKNSQPISSEISLTFIKMLHYKVRS